MSAHLELEDDEWEALRSVLELHAATMATLANKGLTVGPPPPALERLVDKMEAAGYAAGWGVPE